MNVVRISVIVVLTFFLWAPFSPAFEGDLEDGIYRGRHSFVEVEVYVGEGKVEDIRMISHAGGGEKYAEMVEPLIGKMLERQSTDVDAVSGATVSSDNLKRAVEDALGKAKK